MDDTACKLDHLLALLLDFIERQEEPMELVTDLLPVFNRQILLTDRLKSVQFVMFFACERNRLTSYQFLEALTNNLRQPELSKYVFVNNIHYYASYLVHGKQVTNSMATKFLRLVIEYINKQLSNKP